MKTGIHNRYRLLQALQGICHSIIHSLVIFSFIFGGTPLQAGCVPEYTQSPCFRPTTIKDDHTPFAFELCSIYEMARCHDPTLQAAKQALLAAQEAMPQAQASFLPVISAQASHTNAYDNGGGIRDQNNTVVGKIGSYVSNVYTLALTQPILHFEHWQKYEQACDSIKQANATYAFAEQDLMIRTAQAYFGVLEAIDRLYFSTAQLKALKKFYDQTNERFKVGLIAITDVQIAKASHDSAVAQVINSRTIVANQLEKLREIVSYRVEHLLPLKDDLNLPVPEPNDPEAWVAVALKQNFELRAQRYKTLAAREDIKITETGHLPTIDLNGQIQRVTPNNEVQFAGTTSQLNIQVNLPLFSGGSVISKTRQARHTFLQRDKETETLFRNVESNTRQFYLNVITQISQVAAFKQAVISNQGALEATQASFNVGTRTIVDVLNAQTGLIQAQLNLATARYAYILQSFQLKKSAGILSPMDLCNINYWLKPTPADAVITSGDITQAISLQEKNQVNENDRNVNVETTNTSTTESYTSEVKGDSIGAIIGQKAADKLSTKIEKKPNLNQLDILTTPEGTPHSVPTTPSSGISVTPSVPETPSTTPGAAPTITYPGASPSPISDPFHSMPTGVDSNKSHAPPPPTTQPNPTTGPTSPSPTSSPASSSPGASLEVIEKEMIENASLQAVNEVTENASLQAVNDISNEEEGANSKAMENRDAGTVAWDTLMNTTKDLQSLSRKVSTGKLTQVPFENE